MAKTLPIQSSLRQYYDMIVYFFKWLIINNAVNYCLIRLHYYVHHNLNLYLTLSVIVLTNPIALTAFDFKLLFSPSDVRSINFEKYWTTLLERNPSLLVVIRTMIFAMIDTICLNMENLDFPEGLNSKKALASPGKCIRS